MLGALRGFSGGWVAKILIGLLVLSFAVWGISGSILSIGSSVISVGDTRVDAVQYRLAYEQQYQQFIQRIGRAIPRDQADQFGLRDTVLAQLVSGAVLDENTRRMGLGVSDESLANTISEDPNLRDLSGQFSRQRLQLLLRDSGITEDTYIQSRKRVAMRQQIQMGTADSLDVPDVMANALAQYRFEERIFDYVSIGPEVVEEEPTAADADYQKFYDENKSRFTAPEYRKVTIALLQAETIAKPDEVTEEQVKNMYESRKSQLRSPERRRIQQLVLQNDADLKTAKDGLASGKSFEDVVVELGKTVGDIDLGLLRTDELPDQNVADAAFKAELNKPTDPIEGLFGSVIINISEIQEERTTPLEEIEVQLRQELARTEASNEVFALYDEVEDERAAGSLIKEAADKAGVTARVIEAIDRDGNDKQGNPITGIPNLQQFVTTVFETEPQLEIDPLQIGRDGYLWVEVEEIIEERQKEYDEVKDDVKTAWVNYETDKQVKAVADKIAERVRAGEDFNTVLGDSLKADSLGQAVTFQSTSPISRSVQNADLGQDALVLGFSDKKGTVFTVPNAENTHIVMRITEVQFNDNKLTDEQALALNNAASSDIVTQVVTDLQSREPVTVNQAAIDLALTPYGGHGGQHGY